jgi:hypothetical protein
MAPADQDGEVVVLKVYMDESGVHDNSPVLTVAAYLARPSDWRKWTRRWNATKKPIKVCHATDAANLHGEFEGWTEERVAELAAKLCAVTTEADFPGIVIGIHMDEFRKAIAARPDLKPVFPTPYVACFQWIVQAILNIQASCGTSRRIGFVHECNAYQHEALDAFNWVSEHANPQGTVVSLQFGTKAEFVPLQAADILAYEGNKRLRDPKRPERRPWKALDSARSGNVIGGENVIHVTPSQQRRPPQRCRRGQGVDRRCPPLDAGLAPGRGRCGARPSRSACCRPRQTVQRAQVNAPSNSKAGR